MAYGDTTPVQNRAQGRGNPYLGRGFGLHLGLNPQDRRSLRQAAMGGTLNQLDPTLSSKLSSAFGRSGQYADAQRGRLASKLGVDQGLLPGVPQMNTGGGYQTPAAPPAASPTPPAATGAPTGGGTLADLLKQYQPPDTQAGGGAQSYLTAGLSRLNAIPTPSYQDMFQRWMDTANRGAEQQAAQLNEAFGSRGARYGSDVLNAQRDLRQRQTQDLAQAADQIGMGLNAARVNEQGQLLNTGTNLAQIQSQTQENALQRLFQDFLRRTAPPPLLPGAAQYATSGAGGDIVAY